MGPGDDVSAAIAPLPDVPGENPVDREARLLAHIGRHITGRELVLRTDLRLEIERLGDRMDAALHHVADDLAEEQRAREDADRDLAAEQREVPRLLLAMKGEIVQMKSEILTALPVAQATTSRPEGIPVAQAPTLAGLIQTSWPVRALVAALAALLAASAVGVLALAIGSDRAGDVAGQVVDKIPRYRVEAEPPTSQEPEPGAPPQPQP